MNNEAINIKKKESERKDIKDIGEFLRNKKSEMKYLLNIIKLILSKIKKIIINKFNLI